MDVNVVVSLRKADSGIWCSVLMPKKEQDSFEGVQMPHVAGSMFPGRAWSSQIFSKDIVGQKPTPD